LGGDETPLGVAHSELAAAATKANAKDVEREYFELFVGIGRGEFLPYASYYLTGFLHERPLARVRGDLYHIGIEKADGQSEPEDHAAILFEVMSALTSGSHRALPGTDRDFFQKHIAPWIPRFFADLERSKSADFYARVGALGRVFMDIETEAFALPS
jgi:TorA maturation chaperone TorD